VTEEVIMAGDRKRATPKKNKARANKKKACPKKKDHIVMRVLPPHTAVEAAIASFKALGLPIPPYLIRPS
jgi:hypothetical protein